MPAPFKARNTYYLRISSTTVLPLYLYLDEHNTDWMTDRVLQCVLADLKLKILPKLKAEANAYHHSGPTPANAKRGTVDVHRGDTYQFAFFFREAEHHAVLLKTREFFLDPVASRPAPAQPSAAVQPVSPKPPKKRRGKKSAVGRSLKKRRRKSKQPDDDLEVERSERAEATAGLSETTVPRRSARSKKPVDTTYLESDESDEGLNDSSDTPPPARASQTPAAPMQPVTEDSQADSVNQGTSGDVTVKNEDNATTGIDPPQLTGETTEVGALGPGLTTSGDTMNVEEEEPKPKLSMRLRYQGFPINDRCLCVVVEPWPPVRSQSRTPAPLPITKVTERTSSIAPADFVPSGGDQDGRAKTPLFLPDVDQERGETPAPLWSRTLPPVPLFGDPVQDEGRDAGGSDDDDLMSFSQMLSMTGGRVGGGEDDDFDGAVFFADADEAREL